MDTDTRIIMYIINFIYMYIYVPGPRIRAPPSHGLGGTGNLAFIKQNLAAAKENVAFA